MTTGAARLLIRIGNLLVAALALFWSTFWSISAAAMSCAQAAAIAEASSAIPPGLLLAIGNIESGRPDSSKNRAPWAFTINSGGTGRFFETADSAILAVQALQASGLQSVDIGCFQINLFHHPDAFPDLATGFDPMANALAAARFLVSLHEEFGAWEPAIAAYHSRSAAEGLPYRDRVLAAWHGAPFVAATALAGIHVAGIHVWGPNGDLGLRAGPAGWTPPSMPGGISRPRLPRVVTVSIH